MNAIVCHILYKVGNNSLQCVINPVYWMAVALASRAHTLLRLYIFLGGSMPRNTLLLYQTHGGSRYAYISNDVGEFRTILKYIVEIVKMLTYLFKSSRDVNFVESTHKYDAACRTVLGKLKVST